MPKPAMSTGLSPELSYTETTRAGALVIGDALSNHLRCLEQSVSDRSDVRYHYQQQLTVGVEYECRSNLPVKATATENNS